jgi:hypothetical protein
LSTANRSIGVEYFQELHQYPPARLKCYLRA